ncbi:MAG: phosphoribosylanthranilate isomerase [Elainellaceae cyanobacterium]
MWVKICGITQADQAVAIAQLGADALGFICVPASRRYVEPEQIEAIAQVLQMQPQTAAVQRVGVFVDVPIDQICHIVDRTQLTGIQLHGDESPEACQHLRRLRPKINVIKALRVRSPETLAAVEAYQDSVDALLLDAFHPQAHGGTGQTLDWSGLKTFRPPVPWLLAGGITPENVATALATAQPDGIDLSSGVERSPGQKDLSKVAQLFHAVADFSGHSTR